MSAVLGIDVGLSSVKAAIVTREGGLIGRARAAQPPLAGTRQRAVGDWTDAIPVAVRAAMAEAGWPAIECIGVAALGPCPVLIDGNLKPLGSVPLFSLDDAAEAERRAILASSGVPDHWLGPDHVIPRLRLWQRTRPADMAAARLVTDATGYLVCWLTGRPVMDPATRIDHTCEGLEQPLALPDILLPTAVAGGLTKAAANLLGLSEGTPVAASTYDSWADFVGMGIDTPGQSGVLLGSTVILGAVASRVDEAQISAAGLRRSPYLLDDYDIGDQHALIAAWTSSSGSALDWADRTFEKQTSAPMPGAHGLVALPYLAGERAPVWDAGARGLIAGLTLATTRDDLRAAMTEAVSLSTLDMAERLASVSFECDQWIVSGGGVRNRLWLQATADAIGAHLAVVPHAGEAIGPAAIALATIGRRYDPLPETYDIEPDMRRHERYRQLLSIYRKLYPALRDAMHDLGRLAAREGSR